MVEKFNNLVIKFDVFEIYKVIFLKQRVIILSFNNR